MNCYKVVEHIEGFVNDETVAGHVLYHRCLEDDYWLTYFYNKIFDIKTFIIKILKVINLL